MEKGLVSEAIHLPQNQRGCSKKYSIFFQSRFFFVSHLNRKKNFFCCCRWRSSFFHFASFISFVAFSGFCCWLPFRFSVCFTYLTGGSLFFLWQQFVEMNPLMSKILVLAGQLTFSKKYSNSSSCSKNNSQSNSNSFSNFIFSFFFSCSTRAEKIKRSVDKAEKSGRLQFDCCRRHLGSIVQNFNSYWTERKSQISAPGCMAKMIER